MSRVIPGWEEIKKFHNPLTNGEQALIKFLDENLKKDEKGVDFKKLETYNGWLIFVQPYLNGTRPDIIIFNPFVGAVIYEVKDWRLENYSWRERKKGGSEFCVSDSRGTYPIQSPVFQVEHYKEKILGQLVPRIGERMDNNKLSFGLIKVALYFHNATTNKAQMLFKYDKKDKKEDKINNLSELNKIFGTVKDFKYFPVFGNDLLIKENMKQIVPDVEINESRYWNKDWNKELLFWLKPPFHSLEQTKILNLTNKQKLIAEPVKGHYRIRGIAGSGKTQVLAYRAAKLASMNYNVLVITFNITLWHYIQDMIKRAPFTFDWSKITLTYFHGFCKDIMNQYNVSWPEKNEFENENVFRETVPNIVSELVKNNSQVKFDAILIDEGQDYYFEWYNMLCDFLSNRDELVIVCDKKQNIYGRELSWIDKRRKGLEKFGDWEELKTGMRLPEKIANITNEFSETYNLNQELKFDKKDTPEFIEVENFIWKNINDENWIDELKPAIQTIKKVSSSAHSSDTVILLPNKKLGFECVDYFKKMNVDVNHVFETGSEERYHRHKKAFWMGDSRLKVSTIHSFKGWEVLNVIIIIPKNIIGDLNKFDSCIYTAMTRTRQNLYIINSSKRYWDFGDKYK